MTNNQLPITHYHPLYKPNQLICGTGHTVVVTGWTVKESVAKHLDREQFAAIGQLYSPTRGISLLVRNLLYNPHVRFVVAINATEQDRNTGACQCLVDFFVRGFRPGKSDTGRDCWVINSDIPGYIDIEIPATSLETLRHSVSCQLVNSVTEAVNLVNEFSRKPAEPWGEEQQFPLTEVTPTVLPGTRYGHRIEGKTIAETWVKIIHRIKTTGTIRPTGYDGQWQELIDLMAVVTNEPENFYFPEPNYLPIDRASLESYIPQVVEDAPYQEGVKYTYGQRLRSWFGIDQVEQVVNKLIGEIDAASAVMSLWDVKDHEKGGSPCLNHIWVRVVENELSLTATIRSNDMFSAWPANAMGLRALQRHIRDRIAARSSYNLDMGPLITISQSAHIYDDCWENADRLIDLQYARICQQRDYADPVGNFIIELEQGTIAVKQTTPHSGEEVTCYRGRNPLKLIREICMASPAIAPDHIGYLGIELQKAANCLQQGVAYEQDKT